jgi:hypothetical protein
VVFLYLPEKKEEKRGSGHDTFHDAAFGRVVEPPKPLKSFEMRGF